MSKDMDIKNHEVLLENPQYLDVTGARNEDDEQTQQETE